MYFDDRAEQATLGSCLIGKTPSLDEAREIIEPDDFYREPHKILFQALIEMQKKGIELDLVTVKAELESKGRLEAVGGLSYLMQLMNVVPTPAHIGHYAQIVRKKSLARRKRRQCLETLRKLDEGEEPEAVISQTMLEDSGLLDKGQKTPARPLKELISEVFDNLEERRVNKGLIGIETGYSDLDRLTGGLRRGEVTILAARPKMGKTTFALNIALNVAKSGRSVYVVSLEMSAAQLVEKMLSCQAEIKSEHLQKPDTMSDSGLTKIAMACDELSTSRIYIDDSAAIKPSDLLVKLRRHKALHGLDLVVVDYLQLLQAETRRGSKYEEVTEISRAMKVIAKELNVPLLVLSQLSRTVEERKDKTPQPSDLRDSGAIEQDAALVLFLYRDDYYNPDKYPPRNDPSETICLVSLNRFGGTGAVKFMFHKAISRFTLKEWRFVG